MTKSLIVLSTLALAMAGCTENTSASSTGAIAVTSTDDACEVAVVDAPSGTLAFNVTNESSQVTEFYLLADDGLRIVGEVENIGPGLSRDLVLLAQPGNYFTACKPGMVGDGIRSPFTVTDSGTQITPSGELGEQLRTATTQYAAYVKDQTAQLVADTDAFVAAYLAGEDEQARALYAATRAHWERIEPVAESFGDLDPKLDLREADLEPGQDWTGWHRIEKDLWPPAKGYTPLKPKQRQDLADHLGRVW